MIMTLKDYIKQLETRKAALSAEVKDCDDVARLKAINVELDQLNGDIANLRALSIDENDPDGRTKAVNSAVPQAVQSGAEKRTADGEDMEYRKAFMDFVVNKTPIPAELRGDATTTTTTAGTLVPTVLVNRIIQKLDSTGMILPLITRTAYPAGVKIPTSSVKPVASWVNEGAGSDKQAYTTGAISFTYHKLRCEVAVSMEMRAMAISAFEDLFVKNIAEAMVQAIEAKIISTNSGTSSNKGILAETPPTGQALSASALTYATLVEAEAALPQAYENGAVWCMSKKTFMQFIGMTDEVGQPIARVNYGIGGKPERYLLGRPVVLAGDYLPSFSATLTADTIFAFIFRFEDYVLNTVYNIALAEKQDWDTEDWLAKAVTSVDGKVIDVNSLVTIKKVSA